MPQPPQSEIEELPAYRVRRMAQPMTVAIIGGGPAGLEAALYARRLGLKVILFEREAAIAPDVRRWSRVSMFTPWGRSRSTVGEQALAEADKPVRLPAQGVYPLGGEFVQMYLCPLARLLGDAIKRETRVVAVGRSYLFPDDMADEPEQREARRFRLLTRNSLEERIFTADCVIDASGVSHTSRWAGSGGLPALGEMGSAHQIFYDIPDITGADRIRFLGKRTLLIGTGTSAATSALMLAEVLKMDPPGQVIWTGRAPDDLPLRLTPGDSLSRREVLLKKANLLIAQQQAGWEYLPLTQVEALQYSIAAKRFQATLQVGRVTRRVVVDSVIANVGAREGTDTFERALHPMEPGFFTIGAKAPLGGDGACALEHAREQIRDAFRELMADPALDLYAAAGGPAAISANGRRRG